MTPRLSGHFSILGLVFFVLKSLLGIARQWSREKIAILTLKPWSHVKISIFCFKVYLRSIAKSVYIITDT